MNIPMFKYTLIACLCCFFSSAIAQEKKKEDQQNPQSGTLIEEIEVVRPYKPVLADAVKIRRNPDLSIEKPFKPVLTYTILDKKLDLNSNIKELQAQQMMDERQATLINNYVKIGAGSSGTALGEAYVNSGRDEALQAGAFFKHLSQQGSAEKQQFSDQELGIFGRSVADNYSLSGKLMYDRRSTFFYGFDPVSSVPAAMDKQRFSTISAQGELMNNYSESSLFDYTAGINTYQFSNINDARESSVLLRGYINKKMNLLNFGLNASADFTSTKDLAYKIGNNLLKANPHVKLQGKGFELNLGINIVQEFGSDSRLNILPAVSAEVPIITDYAILFGGVNGDVLKTSLKDLASENPFMSKNIAIRNSVEKLNIFAGIKGNAGAEFGYKVSGYFKTVDDFQLFVNNITEINRFDVVYDNGKSNIFGLDGEINVKASDVLSISGKAQIFNYDLASEQEAWFKPTLRLVSNARAQVNQKLFLDAELLFQGDTYARVNAVGGGFTSRDLKGFLDLSAGAEYRVNNKIGVYLRANNLLGQSYQKYLYYTNLGLTVFGGLNYSF